MHFAPQRIIWPLSRTPFGTVILAPVASAHHPPKCPDRPPKMEWIVHLLLPLLLFLSAAPATEAWMNAALDTSSVNHNLLRLVLEKEGVMLAKRGQFSFLKGFLD